LCLSSSSAINFFPIIIFLSITLSTGISLHMQCCSVWLTIFSFCAELYLWVDFSYFSFLHQDRNLLPRSRVTRWVCEKVDQNVAQPIYCQNLKSIGTVAKATIVICNKRAKENNRPVGENSPNLVTLPRSEFSNPALKCKLSSFYSQVGDFVSR
jgi:hypothetical protein